MQYLMKFACYLPFLLTSSVSVVLGHMQMSYPLPIRSPLNPENAVKDYNYRAPLAADGSNYPCKGYLVDVPGVSSVEKFIAGKSYTLTLDGQANHGGGSCQLSLSYDRGASFKVFQSMIGGCPLSNSYEFVIPVNAPPGEKVIFAWTWFNRMGNREMYMNCAVVDIKAPAGFTSSSAPFSGPEIFKANIFGKETCQTVEGTDVVFPNPGDKIVYGGAYASYRPLQVASIEGCPANNGIGGYETPQESPNRTLLSTSSLIPRPLSPSISKTVAPSTTTELLPVGMETRPPSIKTIIFTVTITRTADSPATTPIPSRIKTTGPPRLTVETILPTPPVKAAYNLNRIANPTPKCTSGSLVCLDTHTVLLCIKDGELRSLGPVAPGTICKDGEIIRESTLGYCSKKDEGDIKCNDNGESWYFCDALSWVFMGRVPAGTKCSNGNIAQL